MKKLNDEKVRRMLEEQEQFGLSPFKENEQELYTQLFQALDNWPDEGQSVMEPVMEKIAELEDREESVKYRWVIAASMGAVGIATVLTYYFFLPADFYQAVSYLKVHFPIVLFGLCMFAFIQLADHKWIRKTVK